MTDVAEEKSSAVALIREPDREAVAVTGIKCIVDNHREAMDPAKLDEFAASMATHGLLSPIAVCRRADASAGRANVLIYGHRRLAAAKKLGWTWIAALIYEGLTDINIAEMQAIENLQREDLTPVDEARAIEALLAAGSPVEHVAARIDKSVDFVRRRLDLLRLDKYILPLVACGRLPLAHARAIARLGDRQDQLDVTHSALGSAYNEERADDTAGEYVQPLSELRKEISWKLCKLGAARWPKDVSYAGKRACAGCVNNTNTEPVLFEGIDLTSAKGNCTAPACFAIKAQAWEKDPVKLARDKKRDATREAKGEAPIQKGKPGETAEAREIAAERKAFPSTAADKYAVASYGYAVKLLAAMRDRIKGKAKLPADATACVHSMLLASQFGYAGPDTLPNFVELTAAFKLADAYAPQTDRKTLGKLLPQACENNLQAICPHWPSYATTPLNTPMSSNTIKLIDCMEALANRWGVKVDLPRPKPGDFSDTSTQVKSKTRASTELAEVHSPQSGGGKATNGTNAAKGTAKKKPTTKGTKTMKAAKAKAKKPKQK